MYNAASIENYMYHRFSFTTSRIYYRDQRIENLLRELGEKAGLNGFASIQYVYHPGRQIFYLIEVDIRTNSWMPYGRFTGYNFSDGIRSFAYPSSTEELITKHKPDDTRTRVFIFDRDIRRCIKHRNYKDLFKWVINWHGRWKFIPFYDFKLLSRILWKMKKDFLNKSLTN